MQIICEKLFKIWTSGSRVDVNSFLLNFSSGGHFVQWSGTTCALLKEGIMFHMCETILILDQWYMMFFLSGRHFCSAEWTVYAILVEDFIRNIL